MKYAVATIVLSVVGVVVVGASEVHAQRVGQKSAVLRGTVSSMTQQQLLVARRDCENLDGHGAATGAYCTEVQRIIESQALQLVTEPPHFVFFKSS